jgi:hypothetical protein
MDIGTATLPGFPFHRSQDTSVDTTAASPVTSTFMNFKESKGFGTIGVRQAEFEKQMEAMDQKQAELFHLQMNLIREQLGSLTQGLASLRQDCESFRGAEARREVREADFARVVRELQADTERETTARRKETEEFLDALSRLQQAVDHERSDRTHALQTVDKEVGHFKRQQQQHLDADKDLSNRFEHWCMELRATLDKESATRGQKIDELEREVAKMGPRLEKETRDRLQSTDELTNSVKGNQLQKFDDIERELQKISQRLEKETRDRLATVDDFTGLQKTLRMDLERETAARKKDDEEMLRNINQVKQSAEKDVRDRLREVEDSSKENITRSLQAATEERRRLESLVRNLETQVLLLPTAIDDERNERSAAVDKLQRRMEEALQGASTKASQDMESQFKQLKDMLLNAAADSDARLRELKDDIVRVADDAQRAGTMLTDHHTSIVDQLGAVHSKVEDVERRHTVFHELHDKHGENHTSLHERLEEYYAALHGSLSQLGPDAEARAFQSMVRVMRRLNLCQRGSSIKLWNECGRLSTLTLTTSIWQLCNSSRHNLFRARRCKARHSLFAGSSGKFRLALAGQRRSPEQCPRVVSSGAC